jgi:hypothetical protein
MGGQHYALAALPPGKTRYPLYRRPGGPQGRSACVQKISPIIIIIIINIIIIIHYKTLHYL